MLGCFPGFEEVWELKTIMTAASTDIPQSANRGLSSLKSSGLIRYSNSLLISLGSAGPNGSTLERILLVCLLSGLFNNVKPKTQGGCRHLPLTVDD